MLVSAEHLADVLAASADIWRCGQTCAPHEAARVAVLGRGASTPVVDVIIISNHGHHESHRGGPVLETTVRKTSLLGRRCENERAGRCSRLAMAGSSFFFSLSLLAWRVLIAFIASSEEHGAAVSFFYPVCAAISLSTKGASVVRYCGLR